MTGIAEGRDESGDIVNSCGSGRDQAARSSFLSSEPPYCIRLVVTNRTPIEAPEIRGIGSRSQTSRSEAAEPDLVEFGRVAAEHRLTRPGLAKGRDLGRVRDTFGVQVVEHAVHSQPH